MNPLPRLEARGFQAENMKTCTAGILLAAGRLSPRIRSILEVRNPLTSVQKSLIPTGLVAEFDARPVSTMTKWPKIGRLETGTTPFIFKRDLFLSPLTENFTLSEKLYL
jgi:hypothetical protein